MPAYPTDPQFNSLRHLAASPVAGMKFLTLVADVPTAEEHPFGLGDIQAQV